MIHLVRNCFSGYKMDENEELIVIEEHEEVNNLYLFILAHKFIQEEEQEIVIEEDHGPCFNSEDDVNVSEWFVV